MLKRLFIIFLFFIIIVPPSYSYEIEPESEYIIDGPANVRKTPNGDVIYSLPDESVVKVIKVDSKWCLVEYQNDTSKDGAIILGWTYESNIKGPKGVPLSTLIKQSKVVIANNNILIFSDTSFIEFLGEKISIIKEVAKPKVPIKVNIYCLDGFIESNEIIEINLEYGSDSGSYFASLKMNKKLPENNCIVVNGLIDEGVESNRGIIPDEKMIDSIRPKAIDNYRGTKQAYTPKFTYTVGDFNDDGVAEVITNTILDGAPFYSEWNIYQIDNNQKLIKLGKIGAISYP